ncbi:hypothetical protein KEM52_000253 [Ascosphaera acerosa]|nr:hypothetical protein KEM52_000253 [Ascosphaera acerosa]
MSESRVAMDAHLPAGPSSAGSPPAQVCKDSAETDAEAAAAAGADDARPTATAPVELEPLIPAQQWSAALDATLDFLANADANTLGGVLAVAIALTYGVFGRLGLILIGAIAGVAGHALWEGRQQQRDESTPSAARRRRELNAELAARVLRWRDDSRQGTLMSAESVATADERLDYTDFQPAVASALTSFTEAIVRQHVEDWYHTLLPSENSFPIACRVALTRFVRSLALHLGRRKPTDIFIQFLTNTASISLAFLSEIAGAVQSASLATSTFTTEEAIQRYLEKYPESSLAGILSRPQQHLKMKSATTDFLDTFLRPEEQDCELVRIFLREILAGIVMESALEQCSSAEFINSWLIYLLEAGETDLMHAIDKGVEPVAQQEDQNALTSSSASVRGTAESEESQARASNEDGEAEREAKRLSALIAADEARSKQSNSTSSSSKRRSMEDLARDGTPSNPESWESVSKDAPTSSSGSWERLSPADAPLPAPPPTAHLDEAAPSPTTAHLDAAAPSPTKPESDTVSAKSHANVGGTDPATPVLRDAPLPTPIVRNISQEPLSFHNASITLMDDSSDRDTTKLRSKPTHDYLLQIEPRSTRHSGWVITRKYTDFEQLHEGLRRISGVSGAGQFTLDHPALPPWKGLTKAGLRIQLERYLTDALHYGTLADSERMRNFLQKETEPLPPKPTGKSPFSLIKGTGNANVFENMGKGVLEALSNTPRDIQKGGKAVFEGMSSVFAPRQSVDVTRDAFAEAARSPRHSQEVNRVMRSSLDASPSKSHSHAMRSDQHTPVPLPQISHARTWSESSPSVDKQLSAGAGAMSESRARLSLQLPRTPRRSFNDLRSSEVDQLPGLPEVADPEDSLVSLTYEVAPSEDVTHDKGSEDLNKPTESPAALGSGRGTDMNQPPQVPEVAASPASPGTQQKKETRECDAKLSAEELDVSVELLFAIINETYSLSSAWAFRKRLLNAAKTFFLKPGNPGLESIRMYLEDSIIRTQSSDDVLASHIESLRQSALPTVAEQAAQPPPKTAGELEELRKHARKIFVTRGMPKALMGVMGASATEEAMGRIFDCLQIREVARGFVFSVLIQALKTAIL